MLIGIAIEMPFALGEMLLGLEVIDIIGTKCTYMETILRPTSFVTGGPFRWFPIFPC